MGFGGRNNVSVHQLGCRASPSWRYFLPEEGLSQEAFVECRRLMYASNTLKASDR